MNFFKTKPRTPPDLVRGLRDALPRLEAGPPGGEVRRKVCVTVHHVGHAIDGVLGERGGCKEPAADQVDLVR